MFAFNKLKISTKLVTSIALSTIVIITLISFVISEKVQEMAESNTEIIVQETALHYAYVVALEMERALSQVRTIAHTFESFSDTGELSTPLTRDQVNQMLKYTIEQDENSLGIYVVFEPNAFDGKDAEFVGQAGHDNTGRFIPHWSENEQGNGILEPSMNYNVEGKGDYYLIPKKTGKETILEPYIYSIHGKKLFVAPLIVPIFNKQKNFIGIVGIDFNLEKMRTFLSTLKLDEYKNAFSQIYSAEGMVINHTNESLAGKNINEVNAADPEYIAAILSGDSFFMRRYTNVTQSVVSSFIKNLPIGNTGRSWSVVINIPDTELQNEVHRLVLQIAMIGGIAILVLIFVVYWMAQRISGALSNIVDVSEAITNGKLDSVITITRQDEVGQLFSAFQVMQTQLRERSEIDKCVTEEINAVVLMASQGNFDQRINLEGKIDTFKTIGEGVNRILELNQSAVKDLTRVFSAVARGDLTQTIINNYSGELAQLKQDANTTVQRLTEVTKEISIVTGAASQGDFTKRISLETKAGTFKAIGESINRVLQFNQLAIKDLTRVFSAVAQGDLTQTITNDYFGELEQLKHDTNSTVQKLTEVLTVIQGTSSVVTQAAAEIAQGNDSLSQRTTEQAASLEETSSNMEEMTMTVQQNAESAEQASQLASSAKERAEQGNHVVKDAILAISEIHKSSKKITEIIGVIDEIAFQTNLLALNAAVEAARAGDQGRGFAVVATEVRNLAQRSAAAAKEIKNLIQDSNLKVEEGTKLANQSGQALEELVIAVKKVNDIVSEIAAASSEQSMGIAQVNKAVNQMDEMVEQNSALVEQGMAASESMKEQAQMLQAQVAFFNMGSSAVKETSLASRPRKMHTGRPISPFFTSTSKSKLKQTSEDNKQEWKDF